MSKPAEYLIWVRDVVDGKRDAKYPNKERVVYCTCSHPDDKLAKAFMAEMELSVKKHFPQAEIQITRTGEMKLDTLQTKTLTEAIGDTFKSLL